MKALTLRIRPLGPLLLRGPGEFDPTSRGVFSYASSLPVPRPSTILGALAAAFAKGGAGACSEPRTWDEVLRCYGSALDSLGVEAVRGPYLYGTRNDAVYVPLLLGGEPMLADYQQVRYYLLEWEGDLVTRYLSGERGRDLVEKLEKAARELRSRENRLEVRVSRRVGVGLRAREAGADPPAKAVRRGLLYEAWLVSYPRDIEIRAKLLVRDPTALAGAEAPVRLGGEQRGALVAVEDARDAFDDLFGATDLRYAVLLSPLPLRPEHANRVGYIGRYDTVGFGFSEGRGRRKPIHAALLEGTLVRVGGGPASDALRRSLYELLGLEGADGSYGVLGRVGYGSFAPL